MSIEHAQGHENHMEGVAHPFEVRLAKEFGHGRILNSGRLWYKDRMSAFLVAAGVVGIMLPVVM